VPRSSADSAGRWYGLPRFRLSYRFSQDPQSSPRLFTLLVGDIRGVGDVNVAGVREDHEPGSSDAAGEASAAFPPMKKACAEDGTWLRTHS
jgi:hypothetical protein